MPTLQLIQSNPTLYLTLATILGLLVGSFLNVVIYRLPIMMQRQWRADCLECLEQEPEPQETFNLVVPRSACPQCKSPIGALQNIPLVSWLLQRGQCKACQHPISIQYPLVELVTGLLSFTVIYHFGFTLQGGAALIFTWSLVALSVIDLQHMLLPDSITLPVMWLGIALGISDVYVDLNTSVIGAMAGYLALWSVFHLFRLITGKEGMGYGDFKLLALIGAWLGWQMLPLVILLSSLVGAVIGIGLILLRGQGRNIPIPFGPYLAIAGWIALIWGTELNRLYLGFM